MSDKLDIQKSLMQARWVVASADEQESVRLAQKYDLPDMIARLLNIRGVTDEQVEAFLSPTLAKNFPDPFSMAGMTEMAEYVADAIINGKKLAVFGDFEVDGATSTAIFVRFLRYCGVDAPFYIPDRIEEGYGPNIKALESLRAQGADCVLILDCGITSHDVIQQGRDIRLDICVFDHHEAEEQLPAANHVINPKRKDDSSGLDMLAACGVVFMSCVAINAKLREKGFFKDKGIKDAPLKDWLDIVALGTVCDMVPLTSVNRLFVKAGFVRMAQMDNPGIAALCQIAGVNSDPDTYHCGFVMGPRINAGSRVHQADLGAKLLSTDDKEEARNIGFLLEDCNSKRKAIQEEMMREAIAMVRQAGMENDPVLYVGHKD
ncbi:MAG: DHH family phosphoesterase, partial [Pseudomonadota bacterium]|nr:DHH family phosphoesterase [Pseudomonadota bacterium]